MYVHGCVNPIKYLYLQGHFSKRDFREMSFLLWSNNIRMEESIMTDTALRAGEKAQKEEREKCKAKISALNGRFHIWHIFQSMNT